MGNSAANKFLYPGVVDALGVISQMGIRIGAITNSRADVFNMPDIAEYFDFCVSGEEDRVFPGRKPDRRIFDVALADAGMSIPPAAGAWMHVGDDLPNDVGGSAACGATAVLVGPEANFRPNVKPAWSTAGAEEIERRGILAK